MRVNKQQLGPKTFAFAFDSNTTSKEALDQVMLEVLSKTDDVPDHGWELVEKLENANWTVNIERDNHLATPTVFTSLYVIKSPALIGPDKLAIFAAFDKGIVLMGLTAWNSVSKTATNLKSLSYIRFTCTIKSGSGVNFSGTRFAIPWYQTYRLKQRHSIYLFVSPRWCALSVIQFPTDAFSPLLMGTDQNRFTRIPIYGVIGVFELKKNLNDGLSSHAYLNTGVAALAGYVSATAGYKGQVCGLILPETTVSIGNPGFDGGASSYTNTTIKHQSFDGSTTRSGVQWHIPFMGAEQVEPFTNQFEAQTVQAWDQIATAPRYRGDLYGIKLAAFNTGSVMTKCTIKEDGVDTPYFLSQAGALDVYNTPGDMSYEMYAKATFAIEG